MPGIFRLLTASLFQLKIVTGDLHKIYCVGGGCRAAGAHQSKHHSGRHVGGGGSALFASKDAIVLLNDLRL